MADSKKKLSQAGSNTSIYLSKVSMGHLEKLCEAHQCKRSTLIAHLLEQAALSLEASSQSLPLDLAWDKDPRVLREDDVNPWAKFEARQSQDDLEVETFNSIMIEELQRLIGESQS